MQLDRSQSKVYASVCSDSLDVSKDARWIVFSSFQTLFHLPRPRSNFAKNLCYVVPINNESCDDLRFPRRRDEPTTILREMESSDRLKNRGRLGRASVSPIELTAR